jgi:predicted RNA-binding protein with PUA-like domain
MPTAEKRASAEYARRVCERLLPAGEGTRRACLEALADSIDRADAFGAAKWGVTLHADIIRLNVGHVVPFDIRRNTIFLAVMTGGSAGSLDEGQGALAELVDWRGSFDSISSSRGLFVSPENFERAWPLVREANAAFIGRAAAGPAELHLDCQKAHSPGVLAYLRDVLGRDIPEPSYPRLSPEPGAGWRERLGEWLKKNPRQAPEDLRQLREEFVRRFPKEGLGGLTLEQYALGHEGSRESFCYWLEFKTKRLGHMGGDARKFGVWWDKGEGRWRWTSVYEGAEDALAKIKGGLSALIEAAGQGRYGELDRIGEQRLGQSRYGLRCKPLSIYFHEQFLPVWQPEHIRHFLKIFGAEPRGEVLALNRQLLQLLRGLPEFEGFDTLQATFFLYDSLPPPPPAGADEAAAPRPEPPSTPAPAPRELRELLEITGGPRTRNVLLYGPPGTGKTWLVNHFTNYFLLRHNVSAEAADEYWRARGTDEARRLSARVRAEAGGETASGGPAFWWMVANEEEWSWKILFEKGEWFFGKRNLARNFEEAKPGDFIFGYLASPHKRVVALARVESMLETRAWEGNEKEGIALSPIKMLSNPLDWREVVANPLLKNSEPVRLNSRGSMFRLSVEEAHELARMLSGAGNDVSLPTGARGDFAEFVTFHQSFAYEEFVEGLKPVAPEEGEADGAAGEPARDITYKVQPGVFRRICARAEAAWRTHGKDAPRYLLVVDEINRANIAKVLGELITLIEDDKRLGGANEVTLTLPYSGQRFGVPPNLYVLGTMNTADRSIALLDLALRRRFAFVEMEPEPSAIAPAEVEGVDLRALLARLNGRVAALLDRDHRNGHSYFMSLRGAADLRFAWYARVVPLLEEYFYNDHERLRAVLGARFVRPVGFDEATKAALGDFADPERAPHEIARLDGAEFIDALRELAGGAARPEEA